MITPEQIAKSNTEHAHQKALFCWAATAANDPNTPMHIIQALTVMFAVPNGDQRGDGTRRGAQIAGARLKAEGMRSGVPDIFMPYPAKSYGLFIEMKKPGLQTHKNGGRSEDQVNYINYLRAAGYCVIVCYSWQEARDAILNYLR